MKTPPLFKNLYNLEKQPPRNIDFNLNEYKDFLKLFDNPQNSIGKIIHIAGTNGKGSVATIISNILQKTGYRVGLYTSPHLYEINERIKINNKMINDKDFLFYEKLIYEKLKNNEKTYRTFFEAITTLAFLYFKDNNVDFSVIETGLGGRLDATNIVVPLLSVITKIDYDHTKILGNTLKEIAFEKAGIIKKNIPIFTFNQKKEIIDILKLQAKKNNSNVFITNINNIKQINYNQFIYKNKTYIINQLGFYQKQNACLAIDVCAYIKIKDKYIKKGIEDFAIKGRIEILNKEPLIIMDGSHNPSAIKTTLNEIKLIFPQKNIHIIAVFMQDKDYKESVKIMKQYSQNIIISSIPFFRSARENDYKNIKNIVYYNELNKAIKTTLNKLKNNELLLIIGSFYLPQYVLPIIKK